MVLIRKTVAVKHYIELPFVLPKVVYALIDDDNDGIGDRVVTVIDDRAVPNGIAWRNGSLYLAQIDTVWRYDNVDELALDGKVGRNAQLWTSNRFSDSNCPSLGLIHPHSRCHLSTLRFAFHKYEIYPLHGDVDKSADSE